MESFRSDVKPRHSLQTLAEPVLIPQRTDRQDRLGGKKKLHSLANRLVIKLLTYIYK